MGERIKMNLRERYFENDSKYNQMLAKLNRISMGFLDSEDITSDFFEGMSDTAVDKLNIRSEVLEQAAKEIMNDEDEKHIMKIFVIMLHLLTNLENRRRGIIQVEPDLKAFISYIFYIRDMFFNNQEVVRKNFFKTGDIYIEKIGEEAKILVMKNYTSEFFKIFAEIYEKETKCKFYMKSAKIFGKKLKKYSNKNISAYNVRIDIKRSQKGTLVEIFHLLTPEKKVV